MSSIGAIVPEGSHDGSSPGLCPRSGAAADGIESGRAGSGRPGVSSSDPADGIFAEQLTSKSRCTSSRCYPTQAADRRRSPFTSPTVSAGAAAPAFEFAWTAYKLSEGRRLLSVFFRQHGVCHQASELQAAWVCAADYEYAARLAEDYRLTVEQVQQDREVAIRVSAMPESKQTHSAASINASVLVVAREEDGFAGCAASVELS